MNRRFDNADEFRPKDNDGQETGLILKPGRGAVQLLSAQHSVLPTSSVVGHWVNALKERIRLRIDERAAKTACLAMQTHLEHLSLLHQYQSATRKFQLEEMERQVRETELEQRMENILIERRLNRHLERARQRKEEIALQAEMAKLESEIRKARTPPKTELTPVQQRAVKKTETEELLRRLEAEEAKAVQRTHDELEKRRLKNMYANRREQLMEQLEKYI